MSGRLGLYTLETGNSDVWCADSSTCWRMSYCRELGIRVAGAECTPHNEVRPDTSTTVTTQTMHLIGKVSVVLLLRLATPCIALIQSLPPARVKRSRVARHNLTVFTANRLDVGKVVSDRSVSGQQMLGADAATGRTIAYGGNVKKEAEQPLPTRFPLHSALM